MKVDALISYLFLFSLLSCASDKSIKELPLPDIKVVAILSDMHYAEVSAGINRKANVDSLKLVYTQQVLAIHKIDTTVYNEIMEILESDLDLYYKIEQKVHKYLKSIRDKNSSKSPKKKK